MGVADYCTRFVQEGVRSVRRRRMGDDAQLEDVDGLDGNAEEHPLVTEEKSTATEGHQEPQEFSMFELQYVGIIFNYFSVGLVPAFLNNPTTMFIIQELDASPAAQ